MNSRIDPDLNRFHRETVEEINAKKRKRQRLRNLHKVLVGIALLCAVVWVITLLVWIWSPLVSYVIFEQLMGTSTIIGLLFTAGSLFLYHKADLAYGDEY